MAKDVGILYADIAGSAQLHRALGAVEAKHQVERCLKRMERSVDSYKGTLLGPTGDQLVATFPTADATLQAALDMQRRVADLPPVSGVRLSIRIGVHFGGQNDDGKSLSGSAAEIGEALLKLAGAGQIVTGEMTVAALGKAQQECLRPIGDMVLATPLGDCQLFEVTERTGQASFRPGVTTTNVASAAPERLFVRHNGTAYVVDRAAPHMSFGRDRLSTFVLHGSKASRHHAVIEKRGRDFVLIDQSTNGTYLKAEGAAEQRVLDGEVVITGRGTIGFGLPTESDGESVEFELA